MTLGSCSRYIELCPPPFGYSSKHMESFRCLLPREFMLMPCCLSLIICRAVVQGKFLPRLSRPLCSLSLALIPGHPERPIKSLFKINEAFSLIIKILQSMTDELSKTSRQGSRTLILHSYLIFEYFKVVSRALKTSSPAIGPYQLLEYGYYTCISFFILRCRSIVYCSRLHFIQLYDMDLQCI